jgi:hypothetical protein
MTTNKCIDIENSNNPILRQCKSLERDLKGLFGLSASVRVIYDPYLDDEYKLIDGIVAYVEVAFVSYEDLVSISTDWNVINIFPAKEDNKRVGFHLYHYSKRYKNRD